MSRFLKALALVAPQAAMRRHRAITALDAMSRRRYEGATAGRRGDGWSRGDSGANGSISASLRELRARSHEFVENSWAAMRILDVSVSHMIGEGIQVVADNGSDRVNQKAQNAFDRWAETADVSGEHDFHALSSLMVRSALQGGGSLLRFVRQRRGGPEDVPLKLYPMESEFLDHQRDGPLAGRNVRLGTALGEYGERQGYYLYRQHPNEAHISLLAHSRTESEYYDRADVAHLFRELRIGQLLGVPVFAPILLNARDLSDLLDAVIVKHRTEACFAGFVISQDGGENPLADLTSVNSRGQSITGMEPGMIAELKPGQDIRFAEPKSTAGFEPVYEATMYAMAAGAGITYDQLTGDLRGANYSSLRAGKIEFRRQVKQFQRHTIIPKLHRRVVGRFTDDAIMAGVLAPRAEGYRWRYIVPAHEPIDPTKDLQADILAVRSGRMTPQDFISAYGGEWRDTLNKFETFVGELDSRGMVFDIDPRRVNRTGSVQPASSEPDKDTDEGGEAAEPEDDPDQAADQ